MSRPDQIEKAHAAKRRTFAPELQRIAEKAYRRWRWMMTEQGYETKDHSKQAWISQYAAEVERRISEASR